MGSFSSLAWQDVSVYAVNDKILFCNIHKAFDFLQFSGKLYSVVSEKPWMWNIFRSKGYVTPWNVLCKIKVIGPFYLPTDWQLASSYPITIPTKRKLHQNRLAIPNRQTSCDFEQDFSWLLHPFRTPLAAIAILAQRGATTKCAIWVRYFWLSALHG